MRERIQDLFNEVTLESTPENLSDLRQRFFTLLEEKTTEIRSSEDREWSSDEISIRLMTDLVELQINDGPQRNFLSACSWIMNNLLQAKFNQDKQAIKDELRLTENDDLVDIVIKRAYDQATSYSKVLLEKICLQVNLQPPLVTPQGYQLNELSTVTSNTINKPIFKKQLPIAIQFQRNIALLTSLWNDVKQSFNKWARSNKNADLFDFGMKLFKLTHQGHKLSRKVLGEFGSDDVATAFRVLKEVLSANNVPMILTVISPKQVSVYNQLMDHIADKGKAVTEKDIAGILSHDQSQRPDVVMVAQTLSQQVLVMLGSALRLFKLDNSGAFVNRRNSSTTFKGLEKTAVNLAVNITQSLSSTGFLIASVTEALAREEKFAKSINRSIYGTDTFNKSSKIPVVVDTALDVEQQAALRHRIAAEKYTLSDVEFKLLARALEDKVTLKLIPDTESGQKSEEIKTYQQFIDSAKNRLAAIEARNEQRLRFSPFKERTDHIKAAIDFVQYMQFKYNAETKSHIRLKEGDKSLSDALVTTLLIVKDRKKPEQNMTKGNIFKQLFDKTISGLSGLFATNKALKELNKIHKNRLIELDSQKKKTGRFPSKRVETTKLSAEKRLLAAEDWRDKKSKRNVKVLRLFTNNCRRPFTSFDTVVGAANGPHFQRSNELSEKLKNYKQTLDLDKMLLKATEYQSTLFELQDTLIQLYEDAKAAEGKNEDEFERRFGKKNQAAATYDEVVKCFETVEANMKKLQQGATLNDYYTIFLPEVSKDDRTFKALLEKVQNLNDQAATIFGQTQTMLDQAPKLAPAKKLPEMRQITHDLYLEQVQKLVSQKDSLPELSEEFQKRSDTAKQQLGDYVETVSESLTDSTKKLEGTAATYQSFLSAEIDARNQLTVILNELPENDIDNELQSLIENLLDAGTMLDTMQFLHRGSIREVIQTKLEFLIGSLREIADKTRSIDAVKIENSAQLNELQTKLKFEQGRAPIIINSAKEIVESLKYRAAHTTQLLGLPNYQA
jgi:hypothetical protein